MLQTLIRLKEVLFQMNCYTYSLSIAPTSLYTSADSPTHYQRQFLASSFVDSIFMPSYSSSVTLSAVHRLFQGFAYFPTILTFSPKRTQTWSLGATESEV